MAARPIRTCSPRRCTNPGVVADLIPEWNIKRFCHQSETCLASYRVAEAIECNSSPETTSPSFAFVTCCVPVRSAARSFTRTRSKGRIDEKWRAIPHTTSQLVSFNSDLVQEWNRPTACLSSLLPWLFAKLETLSLCKSSLPSLLMYMKSILETLNNLLSARRWLPATTNTPARLRQKSTSCVRCLCQ